MPVFTAEKISYAAALLANWNGKEPQAVRDALDDLAAMIQRNQGPEKTLDETINNDATLQDDDELTEPVDANTEYDLTLQMRPIGHTTPDWKFKVDLPASATIHGHFLWGFDGTTTGQMKMYTTGQVQPLVLFVTGFAHIVTLWARVAIAGTAGNCKVRWAQNFAHASDLTVKAGSYLSLARIN